MADITKVYPFEEQPLVCVLCGEPWLPAVKNVCQCGGFCTWGRQKLGAPDSWIVNPDGTWTPRSPYSMIEDP